jgi:hypothetical protein
MAGVIEHPETHACRTRVPDPHGLSETSVTSVVEKGFGSRHN